MLNAKCVGQRKVLCQETFWAGLVIKGLPERVGLDWAL